MNSPEIKKWLGKVVGAEAEDLLQDCAEQIFIPENVVVELGNYSLPDFIEIKSLSISGQAFVRGAIGRLHEGELSVMLMAQEVSADYVILDDLLARRKAQSLGIKVMGTVGLLLLMEKRKLLTNEKFWQSITELTSKHGMYLSSKIIEQLKITTVY